MLQSTLTFFKEITILKDLKKLKVGDTEYVNLRKKACWLSRRLFMFSVAFFCIR